MGSPYQQQSWGISGPSATTTSTETYPWIATAQTLTVPSVYPSDIGASDNISSLNFSDDSRTLRSPAPPNVEVLGTNSAERKLNRDGQPAKRRGPKPDNKPAQTRRQELNRQAQRTHREKKENYIKDLEDQNAQLRAVIKERDLALAENENLKGILRANGIPYPVRAPSAAPSYADPLTLSGTGGDAALYGRSPGQHHHQPLSSTSPVPSLGLTPQTSPNTFYGPSQLAVRQNIIAHGQAQQPLQQPQSDNMMSYDQLDVGYMPTVPQDPTQAELQLQQQQRHQVQITQQQHSVRTRSYNTTYQQQPQ